MAESSDHRERRDRDRDRDRTRSPSNNASAGGGGASGSVVGGSIRRQSSRNIRVSHLHS
jgi:hypothetical protein